MMELLYFALGFGLGIGVSMAALYRMAKGYGQMLIAVINRLNMPKEGGA